MRFYDMKKITLIASLLVVFTACQKADIRPRTSSMEQGSEVKSLSIETPTTTNGGNPNSLGGSDATNPTVDPNNPDPNGGDITDPLRKKHQKDNK